MKAKRYTQRRYTAEEKMQFAQQSLQRIRSMPPSNNDVLVIMAFAARGIPVDEIDPRGNVLTYGAWSALGRHVRKGEKSIAVPVIATKVSEDKATGEDVARRFTTTAHLFHISQTDANTEH